MERNATTVPVLPSGQIDKLFTTHSIKLGRLTGSGDIDSARPGDEGLKVYVVPIDQANQPIKAAGDFTVDAFDLSAPDHPRIGHWTFPAERNQDLFYSMFTLYTYILPCPWQQLPKHNKITIHVTFDDLLTHRRFELDKPLEIQPTAATLPASQPSR